MDIPLHHLILTIMVITCPLHCLSMITITTTKSNSKDIDIPHRCPCTIIISMEVSWKGALLKRWKERNITEGNNLIMAKGDRKAI
jgi:hypothetical protein